MFFPGQTDLSQSTAHLITPPISPAIVSRGSVINQGPMAARPSSVDPSLSAHSHCSSYSECLYQTVPQTNQNFYGAGANYPVMFRAQTHPPLGSCPQRAESSLCPAANEQQRFSRDYFNNSCAVSSYSTRSLPLYGASSAAQETHCMQILNNGSCSFVNNTTTSSCQGASYSTAASNGINHFQNVTLLSLI